MEKLKFKHLNGEFGTFRFFRIFKIGGFVFVKINLILYLPKSSQNMDTYFTKLAVTCCLNSVFLIFNLTQMK